MLRAVFRTSGFAPARLWSAWREWPRYVAERRRFRSLPGADALPWGDELPMLGERGEASGGAGAYFLQDQLVARWIYEQNPRRHVDVGSRLDGFVGSVSVFREVEVLDIRPQPAIVPNVRFHQLDLMQDLPGEWLECTDSLSCLHTIEHFGLGRYGDALDPLGHLRGLERLKRMVAPGGMFYLSTPMGRERVEFNAHRVFGAGTLLGWFADGWMIERFAVIDDDNRLRESVDWRRGDAAGDFGCRLGVAILAARKG